MDQRQPIPDKLMREVRVLKCGGSKQVVLDYNPRGKIDLEQSL